MIVSLLDNRISYGVVYALSFVQYYLLTIGNLQNDKFAIFPNLYIFLFVTIAGLYLSVSMQEIDHHDVPKYHLLKLVGYASIPTILAANVIKSMIERELKRDNDMLFILGLRILRYIMIIITLFYLLVFVLAVGFARNLQIILVLIFGSLGILGYGIGYELSKIRSEPPKILEKIQLYLFSPVIGIAKRRVMISIFSLLMIFTFLVLHVLVSFPLVYL